MKLFIFAVLIVFHSSIALAQVEDFDSIQARLSEVDVRTATCRNAEETKRILGELEQDVGFVACNTLVIGLLREALLSTPSSRCSGLSRPTECRTHLDPRPPNRARELKEHHYNGL